MKKTILLFGIVAAMAAFLPSCCSTCTEKHEAAQKAKLGCKKDCKKACCASKAKAACKKDCSKPCCSKKKKA